MKQFKIASLSFVFLLFGCSQVNIVSDLITKPSAKEKYKRDLEISDTLFKKWENAAEIAFLDSTSVDLPYLEIGKFFPRTFQVYSYELELHAGEMLEVEAETDSAEALVFIEIFEKISDSLPKYEKVLASEFQEKNLFFEVEKSGIFKVVLQPEIAARSNFVLKMEKNPVYLFPVSEAGNRNIQSFWGATRDGGARSHAGIDIFAPRGTPVLAATDGRIGFTGEKGLGGKQVWLRDSKRKQSLYYAHLDSIARLPRKVNRGDTLGFVGNTGNARTTAPHLHFGIYKGYGGAINPLHFVLKTDAVQESPSTIENFTTYLMVQSSQANLRNRPATSNSVVLNTLKSGDTVQFLGKTENWFHIRTSGNKASFIHESLVKSINN